MPVPGDTFELVDVDEESIRKGWERRHVCFRVKGGDHFVVDDLGLWSMTPRTKGEGGPILVLKGTWVNPSLQTSHKTVQVIVSRGKGLVEFL